MTTMAPGAMSGTDVGTSASSTLTLPASREAWQQPLMQALGDRLQLQIAQRADSARLHLEPPQLGRIEIDIRQQGGALQVQLSASNDDVRQQLRQIAEPLRHELVQRHSGDVSVQVASGAQAAGDGRGRDGAAAGGQPQSNGQQRDAQRQPGRALQDDDHGASGTAGAFADALANNTRTTR
jgi:flagellar hook-length control protein FliK